MSLKMINVKIEQHPPGANELTEQSLSQWEKTLHM